MTRCKIKMVKDGKGSDRAPSGVSLPVVDYLKDEEYEVCDELAHGFAGTGHCKILEKQSSVDPKQKKKKKEPIKTSKKVSKKASKKG